jgi:hypothetical protein
LTNVEKRFAAPCFGPKCRYMREAFCVALEDAELGHLRERDEPAEESGSQASSGVMSAVSPDMAPVPPPDLS